MKKVILSVALLLAMCLSFTSCVVIWVYEDEKKERCANDIASIDIYEITDTIDGLALKYSVPSAEKTIDDLDTLYTPTGTVSEDKYESFINNLNRLNFTRSHVKVISYTNPKEGNYKGYVLKITYKNGDFDIISRDAQIYHTAEGEKEYDNDCNLIVWTLFIKKYFNPIESSEQ